jgi:protein O-mannosyl-transferase
MNISSIAARSYRRPTLLALIAGAIVTAICFANSLPNDFILDDYQIVAINPEIRNIEPFRFLTVPYWGEKSDSGIYRPLTILSFSLEYPLWQRWPGGYRLTNLLLHATNGFLIFLLARGLLRSVSAALAASALYLAHPAHTEPVVGIAGRSELLAAMFFLLAWMFFRRRRMVLCVAAFLSSLLSKENAIVFPAVIALDTFVFQGGFRKILGEWKRFAAVGAAAVLYLGLRLWVLGRIGFPPEAQYLQGHLTAAERVLTSGRAFLKYFQLLIAPVDVTGDYDFNSIPVAHLTDWVAWAGLLLIAITVVFAIRLLKTHPIPAFAVLFFYVAILPVSNWILPTAIIMSERNLYLPSLGFCLIAAWLWERLPATRLRAVAALGVMTAAALLSVSHTYIWRDNLTYFGNVVRVFPNNIRGRQAYGVALIEIGRPEEARKQFEAGLAINRSAPLLVGLAEALMAIDQNCSRARPVLEEASVAGPTDPFVPWLVAACFEREGALVQAEASYRQAVETARFPDPKLLADWGSVLERTGRAAEAREAYRRSAVLR